MDRSLLDNLDYNEIKQLIKRYTTGKPLVQVPELKTAFEDEFFEVFVDQLGRVLDILLRALFNNINGSRRHRLTDDSD